MNLDDSRWFLKVSNGKIERKRKERKRRTEGRKEGKRKKIIGSPMNRKRLSVVVVFIRGQWFNCTSQISDSNQKSRVPHAQLQNKPQIHSEESFPFNKVMSDPKTLDPSPTHRQLGRNCPCGLRIYSCPGAAGRGLRAVVCWSQQRGTSRADCTDLFPAVFSDVALVAMVVIFTLQKWESATN